MVLGICGCDCCHLGNIYTGANITKERLIFILLSFGFFYKRDLAAHAHAVSTLGLRFSRLLFAKIVAKKLNTFRVGIINCRSRFWQKPRLIARFVDRKSRVPFWYHIFLLYPAYNWLLARLHPLNLPTYLTGKTIQFRQIFRRPR